MTRLLAILVSIFLIQMNSYGQDRGKNVYRSGGGYVSLGTNVVNMVSLDNSLRRYQLPELGSGEMNYTIGEVEEALSTNFISVVMEKHISARLPPISFTRIK